MPIDLFRLGTPVALLEEIREAYVEYYDNPTNRHFLFIVFALNHLREWIAEADAKTIKEKQKSGGLLSPGEQFFLSLWEMEEFRTINALCNRSKHYRVDADYKTEITRGMTVNSPVSDSLGQVYYRINGMDSRNIFQAVFKRYSEWLEGDG